MGVEGAIEPLAAALGVTVWPMVRYEADDALSTAAARWGDRGDVEQVVIASPDKDLCQCVRGDRVVLWDRRRDLWLDEAAVIAKHGVAPRSIPDLLALMGDAADGIPGIARWGAKSTAAVLAEYGVIEAIPDDPGVWTVKVRGAKTLARNLAAQREDAMLYKRLATLVTDAPITEHLDDLAWRGAEPEEIRTLAQELGDDRLPERLFGSG